MGEMADFEFQQHLDAIASGDECPKCGFLLYEAPGCQCKKKKAKKAKKKPPTDYEALCALPKWKAEAGFGRTWYTLPTPPSANRYWRTFRGRTVVSAEARNYKKHVGELAKHLGIELIESGDVKFTIYVYRNQKSGDLDNRIKVTLDALRGIAFEDDKQVAEIIAKRHDDKGNGRIVISVERV